MRAGDVHVRASIGRQFGQRYGGYGAVTVRYGVASPYGYGTVTPPL